MSPREAVNVLLGRVAPVEAEVVPAGDAAGLTGRVLAEAVHLDRDSPACDVSAMDGYAVRSKEVARREVPLAGECRIGRPPETLREGTSLRIYTGSPLPEGADAVLRLEDAVERDATIRLREGVELCAGADIRRRGENARAGDRVLNAGTTLTPAAMAALATVGPERAAVFRRLRVSVVTTGDELVSAEEAAGPMPPWRLRDSNGPTLVAMFSPLTWVEAVTHTHAGDSPDALRRQLGAAVDAADVVFVTGGVSKGAYDYVPDVVARIGGETLFHRIRARPGQPTLGAAVGDTPLLGLPGNPLSAACVARRIGAAVLRARAGFATPDPPAPAVAVEAWGPKALPLWWWRAVRLDRPGVATPIALRGSGDPCGPAASDGFLEAPPDSDGAGLFPYYPWSVT